MEFYVKNAPEGAKIEIKTREKDGVTFADVTLDFDTPAVPGKFRICWEADGAGCYGTWSPSLHSARHIAPNWRKQTTKSRIASWLPVQSVFSKNGANRLCIAVSDAKTPIAIATGYSEESANVECHVEFFTEPTTAIKEYKATIRIDTRDLPFYDSIYGASEWWENECGYQCAYVPEHARLPMNSLWYSYHQNLDPREIVRQCELSKPLGMETVIVDDGWQTDDVMRGYAYCGDWEVTKGKFPDMKRFVDDVHATGMKVMLWYSVPYVGIYSKAYERFRDMLLPSKNSKWASLDPRYPEVRSYLVGIYEKAVREWGLDGLKLDFIDSFALGGDYGEDERRDLTSLEDAVERLMEDVTRALKAVNPEIMIEFRQSYIGPTIRKYGNMLRVGDCPGDPVRNRLAIVDMRLTSGKTPVHSDMIMWNYGDSAENAAEQFTHILFSVPQISMVIDKLPEEHYEMLKNYLGFWREHREILLDGKLTATQPEANYGTVRSDLNGKSVIVLYNERIADGIGERAAVVNAASGEALVVKGCGGKKYSVADCKGYMLDSGVLTDLQEVGVPHSGILYIGYEN